MNVCVVCVVYVDVRYTCVCMYVYGIRWVGGGSVVCVVCGVYVVCVVCVYLMCTVFVWCMSVWGYTCV